MNEDRKSELEQSVKCKQARSMVGITVEVFQARSDLFIFSVTVSFFMPSV